MDKIANSNNDIISVTSLNSESREGSVPMSTSGTFSSTGRRMKKHKHTSWVCMGSLVPSESAFSDSGDVAIPVRSRLSDRSVETTMKLRSWKRLFKKMQIQ
jgi:hypothetical protein